MQGMLKKFLSNDKLGAAILLTNPSAACHVLFLRICPC